MNVEELTIDLNNYLSDKETDGCYFINGQWGSGKTYFIKNFFKNSLREKGEMVYLSLSGIETIHEISNNIFIQLHPKLNAITNSAVLNSLSVVSSTFFNMSIDTDKIGQIIKGYKKSDTPKILVLDDLERCIIDIELLIGFISNLFNNLGCKLILIGNEYELLRKLKKCDENLTFTLANDILLGSFTENKKENSKEEIELYIKKIKQLSDTIQKETYYVNIKEKIISKSVNYEMDLNTIDIIIKNDKSLTPKNKIKVQNNIENIKGIIKQYNLNNLRTFKYSLKNMEFILSKFQKNEHITKFNDENVIPLEKIIILNCLSYSIERNNPTSGKFINISTLIDGKTQTFNSIKEYLTLDTLNLKSFTNEIHNYYLQNSGNLKNDYLSILKRSWYYLSESELKQNMSLLLSDFNSNKLNILSFLTTYNYFYLFQEFFKIDTLIDLNDLKNKMISIINGHGEEISIYDVDGYDFRNVRFCKEIQEQLDEISNAIIRKSKDNKKEEIQSNFDNLTLEELEKNVNSTKSFISVIPVDKIIQYILSKMSPDIIWFRSMLQKIYFSYDNIECYFKHELQSFIVLQSTISKHLDSISDKIKRKNVEFMISDLEEIIKKLSR